MVQVLLEGHDIRHELVELIRVFFPKEDVKYIQDQSEYLCQGILVINSLHEAGKELYTISKLYVDNNLINQSIENINSVQVFGNSIDKNIRVAIKKSLYDCLISVSENKIPWGILTGIRPVKIVHDLLDKNIGENDIIRVLTNEYKLFINKAKLLLDTAKMQRKYVYPLDINRYSLYVSIPFCPTRCLYCSFPALPIGKYESYIKEYTSKLIYEIEEISELMKGKKINTVYIGGGTPTAISPTELERIIWAIYDRFGYNNIKEFTVEAGRPDTITKEYLTMLNKNMINRISINPQTMNNETLKLIGRQHKSEDIVKTYYLAKEIGFDVINMDLIMGLPNENVSHIKNTLREIEKLNPENLTIHTLSVKRGSRFKDTIDQYALQTQETLDNMLNKTLEYTNSMGLDPYYLYRQKQILGNYENIGYCKPNKECIYNIVMMEEKETIMAAGMGSVSKIYFPNENRIERVPNFKDLKEYLERVDELVENKRNILKDN